MKVLVLAGGIPQLELMKRLRKKYDGVEILLVDYLKHPVASDYADKFFNISTLDVDAVENVARDEQVDLIITVCTDQALNTVAEVSERLNLPCYIDAKTGKNVTNKKYMKKVMEENRVPTAHHFITEEVVKSLPNGMSFPVIVKPVDCNSSKGVVKVNSNLELQEAVKTAIRYSRTDNAIVEDFVSGRELTIDAFVQGGKSQVLCISELDKIKSDNSFIIFRSMNPARVCDAVMEKIEKASQQIVDAFGLVNCPLLIQLICDGDNISIVEFSARTGGGLKYQLIEQVTGVDIIDATIDISLGQHVDLNIEESNQLIVNEYLYCNDGIFDHLEGFSELEKDGIIDNYFEFKDPGTPMDGANSSGDRIASFTIVDNDLESLKKRHAMALKTVKAISVEGIDILNHEISYPLFTE